MKKGYLLIDGNNLGFANAAGPKLTIGGGAQTQAIYGFVRTIRPMLVQFPMLTPLVLWDGVSWRKFKATGYKEKRDKPPETKSEFAMAELRASYKLQAPLIRKAMTLLGVAQISAANMEADDLAGMLVKRRPDAKTLLISSDKDWIQLVGPTVAWLDPKTGARITLKTIEEKLGVKTPRAWLECKALMGDTSDEIPGVGGIGEKGAKELLNTYGSVRDFLNRMLAGELKKMPKKFQALADDYDKKVRFERNMDLMDLTSSRIQPAPEGLTLVKNEPDSASFRYFCDRLAFISILQNFDNWFEPFTRRLETVDAQT